MHSSTAALDPAGQLLEKIQRDNHSATHVSSSMVNPLDFIRQCCNIWLLWSCPLPASSVPSRSLSTPLAPQRRQARAEDTAGSWAPNLPGCAGS